MKPTIFLFILFELCITFCDAQSTLYITNEGDSAIGKHDSITLTGNISRFIITQTKITPVNQIWVDGPVVLSKAYIDSFYCRRTFFRNFTIKSCVLKSVVVFDSVPSGTLFIDSSTFQRDLKINGHFNVYEINDLYFGKNKVLGRAFFGGSTFRNAKFDFTVFFSNVKFDGCSLTNVSFHWVNFLDSVIFSNSTYESINFTSSTFHKTLNLAGFTMPGKLVFDSSHFNGGLILCAVNSNTVLSFRDVSLPDTLDLSNNPFIVNPIDLTNVRFHNEDNKCAIFLYKTDISKIQLDYKYFELKFKILDGHELSKNEKEIIYEALLKNFKDHGQNESYELLDIEYKNFKYGWFVLPRYWNCYGYHKEFIFFWTILLLVIFTIITFFKIDKLTRFVYKINHIPDLPSLKQTCKLKHRKLYLWRRTWLSFTYTTTIFFLFLLKVENIKFKSWKGVIYLILMYATGIICIGYIANFILQK